MEKLMKKCPVRAVNIFAAALVATVFSCPAFAAGSVEDLKPAAPVPAAERAAEKAVEDRAARSGRTAFDEFSVIGDPLYRQGAIEFLKKSVEAGKEKKPEEAAGAPAAPAVDAVRQVRQARPGAEQIAPVPAGKAAPRARPSDLRDAPSGLRRALPAPRLKSPAPKPVPSDPVAPRKTS
jgi:hypothetical protein